MVDIDSGKLDFIENSTTRGVTKIRIECCYMNGILYVVICLLVHYSDGDDKRGIELTSVCVSSCRFCNDTSISLAHKHLKVDNLMFSISR